MSDTPKFWRAWFGIWCLIEYGFAISEKIEGTGSMLTDWSLGTVFLGLAAWEHTRINRLSSLIKRAKSLQKEHAKIRIQIEQQLQKESIDADLKRKGQSGKPPDV